MLYSKLENKLKINTIMAKIKILADVQAVPENQHIVTMNYDDYTCPFCGRALTWEIVGFGRDKCRQYHSCSCDVAQAAEAHNKLAKKLKHEAWLKELERREKAVVVTEEEPLTITAEQMLCVTTGRILPNVNSVAADDAVGVAMRKAGFTKGSSQEKLVEYASQKGFYEALSAAAEEFVESGCRACIDVLCDKYGLPRSLTI